MYLVGLTGGIAAGKSTVARRLIEHGAIEIDADVLAREVVQVGTEGLKKVVEAFGSEILTETGELNRSALGLQIFSDSEKRHRLNSILHPLIRARSRELLDQASDDAIVIYSVPLLVEADVDHDFDLIVTVEAPEEEQVKRLVSNRGLSDSEARNRVASQAKPVERAARANRILNSNQDLNLLLKDVDALWRDIVKFAAKKSAN